MATATDPVCGMTVDTTSAAGTAEHQGQTYYFCSTQCVRDFKADPEQYVGRTGSASGDRGSAEAR